MTEDKTENKQGNSSQASLTPEIINKESESYQAVRDIAEKLKYLEEKEEKKSWFSNLLEKIKALFCKKKVKDGENTKKTGSIPVRNIALTGPYGSGKSSVLETLRCNFPQHGYLSISLANLDAGSPSKTNAGSPSKTNDDSPSKANDDSPSKANDDSPSKANDDSPSKANDDSPSKANDEKINRLIEYSILQQLIYREKYDTIPQSRFKRIKSISSKKAIKYSILTLLGFLCLNILFEPTFFRIESFQKLFSLGDTFKPIFDIIAFIYIIVVLVYVLKSLIISTCNCRLNKLNIKDGEIEINENTSIFNKHLDEIIYFFQVTKYNVVIIEDLDRFETNSIFLKLRELNLILNESEVIPRPIVFIYAVRDDIFIDTNRTKFFDYITTVIPVINPSNACDKLLKELRKQKITEEKISERECDILGFYIDDMRILKNIVNEYVQYSKKITLNIEPRKLLGMILYKNYYPKDFADLHNREGFVYQILSHKEYYIKESLLALKEKIKNLESKKEDIETKYRYFSDKELRALYVMKYLEKEPEIIQFYTSEDTPFTLKQLIEDEQKFNLLKDDKFSKYQYRSDYYYYTVNFNLKFSDIEKEVDPQFTYEERKAELPSKIKALEIEIQTVKEEIKIIKRKTLKELFSFIDPEKIERYQEILKAIPDKKHLIPYLIQEGYIEDDYYNYISYFYPGILSEGDKEFIACARINRFLELSYPLDKVENLVEKVREYGHTKTLLNLDLIDYLSSHKEENKNLWYEIINSTIKYKSIHLITAFYETKENSSDFIKTVLSKWESFVKTKEFYDESEKSLLLLEITLKNFPFDIADCYRVKDFINLIASKLEWVNKKIERIGLEQLEKISLEFEVKYDNISIKQIDPDFMQYIIDNSLYLITQENLCAIVNFLAPEKKEDFRKSSYTTLKSLGNQSLNSQLLEHLEVFIYAFPTESKEESPESMIEIINSENIFTEDKQEYLTEQIDKIKNLDSIQEDKDVALASNCIAATWENIAKYIEIEDSEKTEIDEEKLNSKLLLDFVTQNSEELSKQIINNSSVKEETQSQLLRTLIGTDNLPDEVYKLIKNAFNRCFVDLDLSSLNPEKIQVLIDTGGIKFNEFYLEHLEDYFSTQLLSFILRNKQVYLEKIADYGITVSIAEQILSSNEFTTKEKRSLLPYIIKLEDKTTKLHNLIVQMILKSNSLEIENNDILNLLKESSNEDNKISLLLMKSEEIGYDENFVKEALTSMGGEYEKMALQKGSKPHIKNNEVNAKLVLFLKTNGLISSFKEKKEKGEIQVNTKRK